MGKNIKISSEEYLILTFHLIDKSSEEIEVFLLTLKEGKDGYKDYLAIYGETASEKAETIFKYIQEEWDNLD